MSQHVKLLPTEEQLLVHQSDPKIDLLFQKLRQALQENDEPTYRDGDYIFSLTNPPGSNVELVETTRFVRRGKKVLRPHRITVTVDKKSLLPRKVYAETKTEQRVVSLERYDTPQLRASVHSILDKCTDEMTLMQKIAREIELLKEDIRQHLRDKTNPLDRLQRDICIHGEGMFPHMRTEDSVGSYADAMIMLDTAYAYLDDGHQLVTPIHAANDEIREVSLTYCPDDRVKVVYTLLHDKGQKVVAILQGDEARSNHTQYADMIIGLITAVVRNILAHSTWMKRE